MVLNVKNQFYKTLHCWLEFLEILLNVGVLDDWSETVLSMGAAEYGIILVDWVEISSGMSERSNTFSVKSFEVLTLNSFFLGVSFIGFFKISIELKIKMV